MSFWRKGKPLIIQDTVENGSNGIGDAGETKQEEEGVSHELHPGELTPEESVAGGFGRYVGLTSTTFLMCDQARTFPPLFFGETDAFRRERSSLS